MKERFNRDSDESKAMLNNGITSSIHPKLINGSAVSFIGVRTFPGNESSLYGRRLSERSNFKGTIAQWIATGGVLLVAASCGMPIGYSAILLPQLQFTNSTLPINEELGSWIASIHSAATPIGSLLSGILMERVGRCKALQLSLAPLIAGWVIVATAHHHGLLLAGRIIAGIAVGSTTAPAHVYICEISEPHLRGVLGSFPIISYSLGILLVYALGYIIDWRTVAGLSIVLPLCSFAAFTFLPESPVWLVRHGFIKEAAKAMDWLRGGGIKAQKELQQLILRVQKEEHELKIQNESNIESCCAKVMKPQVLKPFIILNVFYLLQIFSGTYLVVFYAVDIIAQIGETDIDHFFAAVLTAIVRLLFTVIAAILITFVGRRPLAIYSGLGTSVSALTLGTYLYLRDPQYSAANEFYITAGCILMYVATNTIGLMVLPALLVGELLPAKVRGLAGGITFFAFNFVLFGVAKMFPLIKNSAGVHGVFWIFGGSSLLLAVFLFLLLPETKGKTLSQIEDYFTQRNFMWITREEEHDNEKTTKV